MVMTVGKLPCALHFAHTLSWMSLLNTSEILLKLWLLSGSNEDLEDGNENKARNKLALVPLFQHETFALCSSYWDSGVRETESILQPQRKQKIHYYFINLVINL